MAKRPSNYCNACGYTWYPRGKNVSRKCPNCGSTDVTLTTIKVGAVAGPVVGLVAVALFGSFVVAMVICLAVSVVDRIVNEIRRLDANNATKNILLAATFLCPFFFVALMIVGVAMIVIGKKKSDDEGDDD